MEKKYIVIDTETGTEIECCDTEKEASDLAYQYLEEDIREEWEEYGKLNTFKLISYGVMHDGELVNVADHRFTSKSHTFCQVCSESKWTENSGYEYQHEVFNTTDVTLTDVNDAHPDMWYADYANLSDEEIESKKSELARGIERYITVELFYNEDDDKPIYSVTVPESELLEKYF